MIKERVIDGIKYSPGTSTLLMKKFPWTYYLSEKLCKFFRVYIPTDEPEGICIEPVTQEDMITFYGEADVVLQPFEDIFPDEKVDEA